MYYVKGRLKHEFFLKPAEGCSVCWGLDGSWQTVPYSWTSMFVWLYARSSPN